MIHEKHSKVYMTPGEGSYLILEGNCTSADSLADTSNDNEDFFHPNVRADTIETWKALRHTADLVCMQL